MVSIFVHEQITKLLATNADGTKQFGVRDQFVKLEKKLGREAACGWIRKHVKVTQWCQGIMTKQNWLGCDTETTSVGPEAEVVEFSLVRPDSSIAYDSLWKSTTPITAGSQAVHGITNADIANAPTIKAEAAEVQALLNKAEFVMFYNGAFDIDKLEQSAFAYDMDPIDLGTVVDPMREIGAWIGEWNARRSGYKWAKLEGGHRAAADIQEMIRMISRCASSNTLYALELIE